MSARPSPRRWANTQTYPRGVFYGTIRTPAGLWPHSGLATVSSLGQAPLASLLPKNGRRNQFLRGHAALQTPLAPEALRRVCFKHFAHVQHTTTLVRCRSAIGLQKAFSLGVLPTRRGTDGPYWPSTSELLYPKRSLAKFIGSYTPPKSKLLQ